MPCPCRCLLSRSTFVFIAVAICTALLVYWHVKRSAAPVQQASQAKVIFAFLGAPGSGKGTLADRCIEKLGYKKLSTGDLCRENIKLGTELGTRLQEYTAKGALAPDEIINAMVKEWLNANTKTSGQIILDGYPRTAAQAAWLVDFVKNQYPEYKLRVIALNISDESVVQRIAGRLTCSNAQCKAIFNSAQFPGQENPICPTCKSHLVRREDDREEVVRERLKVYAATSKDLIGFFKNAGIPIEEINVEGKGADQVFQEFKQLAC
jgi:adenylate kinase